MPVSAKSASAKAAPPLSEIALLVLLGLLWGSPYALTKIALATIPPITLAAGRVVLAAAFLWIVVWMTGAKIPWRSRFVPQLFIQGMLACVLPYTLITFGQQSVDSALAAILNSTTPLFAFLISLAGVRHEDIRAGSLFGVAVGMGGIVLIAGADAFAGIGKGTLGQAAILLATASSACSVIYARRLADIAPSVVAAGMLTAAAVVLVPLCFVAEHPLSVTPSSAALIALAVNGIAATAVGFLIYFRIVGTIGIVGTASVGYLKPVVGVLVGCLVMGEHLTWTVATGLVTTCIGVAAINYAKAGWWKALVHFATRDTPSATVVDEPGQALRRPAV
jgi:drug/metabolite transporter (DMT)-like permease